MGGVYSDFTPVEEAHEIFQSVVLEERHHYDDYTLKKLREHRSLIHKILKDDVNVRVSIFIKEKEHKFRIGSGVKYLIFKSEWSYEFKSDYGLLQYAWHHRQIPIALIFCIGFALLHWNLDTDTYNQIRPYLLSMVPALRSSILTNYVRELSDIREQR